ncbi:response regulator [Leptothoe sp. PORK10 BA2]|uniref:response regulator n=1 Tax=Leptothoe sp. PORK10 BA2 TaxID=3110254 RepID=UPI002B1EFE59|nr:response regulator [Leptothoe sp. PORK10 BA2]MEA5464441.1 response regulator [Leptothoe sp. PORK10 BA2]
MSHQSIIAEIDHKIQRAKSSLFTGVLAIGIDQDVEWFLYFLVGQIVWANDRTHSNRRWQRQFFQHSSDLNSRTLKNIIHRAKNYQAVAQLVMGQEFSREKFSAIVRGCISEILFDMVHQATLAFPASTPQLIYKASARNGANFPCVGLQRKPIWQQVQQDWQDWQQANLMDYGPNLAPTIVQPDILQERTSPTTFQALTKLANGKQALRDLAIKTNHPLIPLTQSLVPHIRRDLIKLVPVDDLVLNASSPNQVPAMTNLFAPSFSPAVVATAPAPQKVKDGLKPGASLKQGPIVVYVDDNPADSQTMANIFQGSGYQYVNIADSLKALPKLLELKPQLIFLDLVMPVVNGYELCAQIRRISVLKNVPVIIMTNNNGIPDRVRAKVVGSNGFLAKPIKAKQVLKVAIKHLQPTLVTTPVAPPRQTRFHRLSPSV